MDTSKLPEHLKESISNTKKDRIAKFNRTIIRCDNPPPNSLNISQRDYTSQYQYLGKYFTRCHNAIIVMYDMEIPVDIGKQLIRTYVEKLKYFDDLERRVE